MEAPVDAALGVGNGLNGLEAGQRDRGGIESKRNPCPSGGTEFQTCGVSKGWSDSLGRAHAPGTLPSSVGVYGCGRLRDPLRGL